ncbi:MAG: ATP-binding cassette domain-containing protein, partial [Turicibacter sp.]
MIKLCNVTKNYSDTIILDKVNFEFPQNGLVCILGASGCGKTTLLNLLAGFDTGYSGEITVCGTSISKMDASALCHYRKDNVGFIFQNYHLLRGYTALDNILLACEFSLDSLEDRRHKALQLLDDLNLKEKANEKIENLSGGQKQRVAIARALISEPKIIFADEPTGALDRKTSTEIMNLLKEISKDRLVIVITHDSNISSFADEILTLEDSKILTNKKESSLVNFTNHLNQTSTGMTSEKNLAVKNFKVHIKRYLAVSLAISIGIIAFILSLSSSNLMEQSILDFQEKNTAFNNGYIKGNVDGSVLTLLSNDERIENIYYQYTLYDLTLSVGDKTEMLSEKLPMPKTSETLSYGVMPRKGLNEIAISPSLAKKFTDQINTLVGETLTLTMGSVTHTLVISGIFNAGYDDFFISSDIEQSLYTPIKDQEIYSISYDVSHFSDIVDVSQMLELNGISSKNASDEVFALQTTFTNLTRLFIIL